MQDVSSGQQPPNDDKPTGTEEEDEETSKENTVLNVMPLTVAAAAGARKDGATLGKGTKRSTEDVFLSRPMPKPLYQVYEAGREVVLMDRLA